MTGERRGTYRKPTAEEAAGFAAIDAKWHKWRAAQDRRELRAYYLRNVVRGIAAGITILVLAAFAGAVCWAVAMVGLFTLSLFTR